MKCFILGQFAEASHLHPSSYIRLFSNSLYAYLVEPSQEEANWLD